MIARFAAALVLVATVAGCISISPATPPTTAPTTAAPATNRPTATVQPPSTSAPQTPPSQATPPSTPQPSKVGASSVPSASASSVPTSGPSGRPTFATVDDAYHQTVAWHSCRVQGLDAQCGTVYVPTDYDNPSTATTAIAIARFASTGTSQGHLFINPGGPGAGGIDFAGYIAQTSPNLAANYDIVGFDPRGTGKSDPITCLDTAALDALNAFDPTPENAQERQQGIQLVDQQGAACEKNTGLLADHVTTIETARDIDVMRAALGDDKTNYFGFSYGTFLGTTLAALFPDKVGRFVLDGAIVPNTNSFTASEMQTKGLQTEFDAYIAQCVKSAAGCPLGDTTTAASDRLRKLLVDIDTNPLQTGDPARPLTQALAFYGIVDTMYSPTSWPALTSALDAAVRGDGFPLLSLSDDYFQRQSNGYINNEIQANQAINCLDEQVAGGPTPIPESTFVADSPIAGDIMFGLADRGCGDWPLRTTLTPPDYSAPGTPTILVVGTTRDPATPYVWAQQLAQLLQHGELLTRVGDGHTAYISGNQCIVRAVDEFFVNGTDPPPGTTC